MRKQVNSRNAEYSAQDFLQQEKNPEMYGSETYDIVASNIHGNIS